MEISKDKVDAFVSLPQERERASIDSSLVPVHKVPHSALLPVARNDTDCVPTNVASLLFQGQPLMIFNVTNCLPKSGSQVSSGWPGRCLSLSEAGIQYLLQGTSKAIPSPARAILERSVPSYTQRSSLVPVCPQVPANVDDVKALMEPEELFPNSPCKIEEYSEKPTNYCSFKQTSPTTSMEDDCPLLSIQHLDSVIVPDNNSQNIKQDDEDASMLSLDSVPSFDSSHIQQLKQTHVTDEVQPYDTAGDGTNGTLGEQVLQTVVKGLSDLYTSATTSSMDDLTHGSDDPRATASGLILADRETQLIRMDDSDSELDLPGSLGRDVPMSSPVSSVPVSPLVSSAAVSPSVSGVPVSSPVSGVPESSPVSSVPASPPVSNVPVSHPVSDVPVSHLVSDVPVSPPVSNVPVSHPVSNVPVSHPVSDVPVYPPVSIVPESSLPSATVPVSSLVFSDLAASTIDVPMTHPASNILVSSSMSHGATVCDVPVHQSDAQPMVGEQSTHLSNRESFVVSSTADNPDVTSGEGVSCDLKRSSSPDVDSIQPMTKRCCNEQYLSFPDQLDGKTKPDVNDVVTFDDDDQLFEPLSVLDKSDHQPTEIADDGSDTIEAALPEPAKLFNSPPHLPHLPVDHDSDDDSHDDDPSDSLAQGSYIAEESLQIVPKYMPLDSTVWSNNEDVDEESCLYPTTTHLKMAESATINCSSTHVAKPSVKAHRRVYDFTEGLPTYGVCFASTLKPKLRIGLSKRQKVQPLHKRCRYKTA